MLETTWSYDAVILRYDDGQHFHPLLPAVAEGFGSYYYYRVIESPIVFESAIVSSDSAFV